MARTLRQEVESYVGPIDGLVREVDQWLSAGAAQLVDLLPPERAEQHAVYTTLPAEGLSVSDKRVISVSIGGIPARHVSYRTYTQSKITGSLESITSTDPGYFTINNMIYSVPLSTEGIVVCISYPVLTGEATTINLPPEFKQPIILYASVQYLINELKTIRKDVTLGWTAFATILDTEEDIELAQAKLQEFQGRLGELGVKMGAIKEQLTILQSQYTESLNLFIKIHYPTEAKQ